MKTLVLSGGGAKGAFQVGAMKRLFESGYHPDLIIGTSVGALNACGISKIGINGTLNLWEKIRGTSDILSACVLTAPFRSGYYSMKPLQKKLKKVYKNKSTIPFYACFVDLKEGALHYGSELNHVLASAAIPGVMEIVESRYCDGGVREQVPIKKSFEAFGATEVICITANPILDNPLDNKWKAEFPKLVNTALRAIDVMEHEVFLNDVKNYLDKIKIISPDKILMDTLDFSPDKINNAINLGYEKASRII